MSAPRLRFAPSPTGNLHIGTLRTALFNWIVARSINATLVLRIEDTDQSRSEQRYETTILDGLAWLGLTMDEGPIRQSGRTELYHRQAHALLGRGLAYRCFCTESDLESERALAEAEKRPYTYSGRCRRQPAEWVDQQVAAGIPHTIKFHVPPVGTVTIDDQIRGEIVFDQSLIGDFVLVKSDQSPSYNFAVVVDDADMGITHVIRGEDHISNTPKQILLFQALGVELPRFAHLPMILGPDKSKLSKRHGATGVTEYQRQGFLADALFNYLVLLGWSSPDGKEIMSRDEIVSKFSLDRVSKSGAVFDIAKLKWMNGQAIRRLDTDQLYAVVWPYVSDGHRQVLAAEPEAVVKAMIYSVRDNLEVLADINLFLDVYTMSESRYRDQVAELDFEADAVIPTVIAHLQQCQAWDPQTIDGVIATVVEQTSLPKGKVFKPIRLAVSGMGSGPHLGDLISILGRDRVLSRLTHKGA